MFKIVCGTVVLVSFLNASSDEKCLQIQEDYLLDCNSESAKIDERTNIAGKKLMPSNYIKSEIKLDDWSSDYSGVNKDVFAEASADEMAILPMPKEGQGKQDFDAVLFINGKGRARTSDGKLFPVSLCDTLVKCLKEELTKEKKHITELLRKAVERCGEVQSSNFQTLIFEFDGSQIYIQPANF
jgi:hypothetical protein